MSGRKKGLFITAVSVLCAGILLTGCVAGESEQKKAGTELMKQYFADAGKKAYVTSIYADITRPAADRLEMTDFVKGNYKFGDEEYEFRANVKTGDIYTNERLSEFSECVLNAVADELGLEVSECSCYADINIKLEDAGAAETDEDTDEDTEADTDEDTDADSDEDTEADTDEDTDADLDTDTDESDDYEDYEYANRLISLDDLLPVTITDMDAFAKEALEREDISVRPFIVCKKLPDFDDSDKPEVSEWNRVQITFCLFEDTGTLPTEKYDILRYWGEIRDDKEKVVEISYDKE